MKIGHRLALRHRIERVCAYFWLELLDMKAAIAALSTLVGATFWFDTLSGVLKLRGSGPIPDRATA